MRVLMHHATALRSPPSSSTSPPLTAPNSTFPSFVSSPTYRTTTTSRRPRKCTITCNQSPSNPPQPPPHPDDPNNKGRAQTYYTYRRRVRIPKSQSHHHVDWQWTGPQHNQQRTNNINIFVEQSIDKVLQVLDKSRQTLLSQITAIGARMLRRVSHVIGRAFLVDHDEIDLTVEYGIADPCPNDKNFVDPLRDWDLVSTNNPGTYSDSFGNIVYLQLHGAVSGAVVAADFRDSFDDCENEERGGGGTDENSTDEQLQQKQQQNQNSPSTSSSSRPSDREDD